LIVSGDVYSINIHGVFFERWCEDLIRSTGLKVVSTNYPVEFPPSNAVSRGKESALDIRAELRKDNLVFTFIIECKKNNPDFVNWIFFPKGETETQRVFVSHLIKNQIKEDPSQGWNVETEIFKFPISVNVFNEARETRANYQTFKDGQKTKTSNAAITEASYQVALATKAIWAEERIHSQRKGAYNPIPQLDYQTQFIVPCIVTTAKLYSCNFEPKDVNPICGEIPLDKTVLEEVPMVVYEYPLPKHLQSAPVNLVEALSTKNLELVTRMDIVIINSVHLKQLLDELNSVENWLDLI
jgi:hypothetical protein